MGLAQACLADWVGLSREDRSTGDGGRLASQGMALVLDLEIAESTRSTSPKPGGPRVDRSNVAGEPTVGLLGGKSQSSRPRQTFAVLHRRPRLANRPTYVDAGEEGRTTISTR